VQTGTVWKFTAPAYLLVDDFESYTNEVGQRVFEVWVDGFGFTQPVDTPGNGTGALVGHDIWAVDTPYSTIMETSIVHGGGQSMPLYYDNTALPYRSEADRTWLVAENWQVEGVTDLTLYVRGEADNDAAALYVVIEDSAGNVGDDRDGLDRVEDPAGGPDSRRCERWRDQEDVDRRGQSHRPDSGRHRRDLRR